MAQNEGPFSKGERLTAVKLNDLAVGRPMTVAGNGVVNRSGGRDAIEIHNPEVMYIRLTEKDTSKTPIRYGWKEVDRLGNPTATVSATWGNMTDRKAKMTDDYAIELNNQNLSVTDNYIYRAERSPATGEWIFFLRKRLSACDPGTGRCSRRLVSITMNLGSGVSPPTDTVPKYAIAPGTEFYDPSGKCVTGKTPNGVTNHYQLFQQKMTSLLKSGVVTIPVPLPGETNVIDQDVAADLTPYLPITGSQTFTDFNNPFPNGCSGPDPFYPPSSSIISAVSRMQITSTLFNQCSGYGVAINRSVIATLQHEITHPFYGKFYMLVWNGSNTKDILTYTGATYNRPVTQIMVAGGVETTVVYPFCATSDSVTFSGIDWVFSL